MFRRAADGAPARLIRYDADRSAVEAARRDPSQFESLYRKYVAQVYNFAIYETRDHHRAEDLTEQVFLLALRGLPTFREQGEGPGSTFRVWLFQIARNALANERRRMRRHPDLPLDRADLVPDGQDVEQIVITQDEAARAWRAIGRLPAERRQALVLRFVDQLSTSEISAVLGKSEGAVRVLIHRALRAVADQLAGDRSAGSARARKRAN